MKTDYNVIIVGAGAAGAALAAKVKRKNILVLEQGRAAKVDSGIVSTRYDELIGKRTLVAEKLTSMRFFSPSSKSFVVETDRPFAYRLHRKKLSRYMRNKIKKKTVYGKVTSVEFEPSHVVVRTEKETYTGAMVVGCDGASSLVRSAAGIRPPALCYGLLTKTNTKTKKGGFDVYLNKYFSPDFFAWMLSGECGVMTAIRPFEYYDYFLTKMGLEKKEVHGSAIPIGFTRSYADRCLLLGDAAGQTKPLTGGGIIFSLMCARHAADIISDAIEQDYFGADLLSLYEKRWRREIGSEIRRQLFFRGIYRRLTNRQIDAMFDDFGAHLEGVKAFDYDRLSSIALRMPKWKLMRTLINVATGM